MCDKHPTVSVVIATYNYGRFLSEAIDSVLAQTFKDFEVIVVDDGSTDNTSEVILIYLSRHNFHYIKKENGGQASAKNRGIDESKGEFIAFLDADDVWFPTKLERQMPLFSDPRVGVVYSKRVLIDLYGNERPFEHPKLYRGPVLDQIFINNFVCFSSAIVKRQCFEKVGKFDESLPMSIDYDLWLRMALHYHFDYVDAHLVMYRVGHGQMSDQLEKRFYYAWRIASRFIEENKRRKNLAWWVIPHKKAYRFYNMGYHYSVGGKRTEALKCYSLSFLHNPFYLPTWKGLLKMLIGYGIGKVIII